MTDVCIDSSRHFLKYLNYSAGDSYPSALVEPSGESIQRNTHVNIHYSMAAVGFPESLRSKFKLLV